MGQLNTITNYITQLLTQHVGQFTYLGQRMFLSLPPSGSSGLALSRRSVLTGPAVSTSETSPASS